MLCKEGFWQLLRFKKKKKQASWKSHYGRMAQWLRTLTALSEDKSSVPSTHIERLTATCHSIPGGSGVLFWPSWVPRHTHRKHPSNACTSTEIKINLKKNLVCPEWWTTLILLLGMQGEVDLCELEANWSHIMRFLGCKYYVRLCIFTCVWVHMCVSMYTHVMCV